MSITYIDLVNRLRDRFNEARLTPTTWTATIGFDQFSKDAINYSYHDILNAEMEWPFLHQSLTLLTIPGVQLYTVNPSAPTGFTSPSEIKTIDWDKFFISPNETVTTITNEVSTVSGAGPYIVKVSQSTSWASDLGVKYFPSGTALTPVIGDPAIGQYSITPTNGPVGTYVFSVADLGQQVEISYTTAVQPQFATIENAQYLTYIDYDLWCQMYLQRDKDAVPQGYTLPNFVFKTQVFGQVGFSPVPDKIYQVNFECWIDGADMVNTTDTPLIPSHFWQVIVDGASKYCYEFRQDPQQAQLADARFKAGIARMRIELINRDYTMSAGYNWRRGSGYANPFAGF